KPPTCGSGLKLGPIRTAQFLARSLAARLGRSCRGSGRRSARSWARGLDLPHRWKRKMTAPARGGAREVLGMKRREFITLLGGAVAWPLAARAQQPGRLRRIGVLMSWDESDPEIKTFLSAFMQGLAELGWTDGGNVRTEVRWAGGN